LLNWAAAGVLISAAVTVFAVVMANHVQRERLRAVAESQLEGHLWALFAHNGRNAPNMEQTIAAFAAETGCDPWMAGTAKPSKRQSAVRSAPAEAPPRRSPKNRDYLQFPEEFGRSETAVWYRFGPERRTEVATAYIAHRVALGIRKQLRAKRKGRPVSDPDAVETEVKDEKQLAALAGVSYDALRRALNGHKQFPLSLMMAIAQVWDEATLLPEFDRAKLREPPLLNGAPPPEWPNAPEPGALREAEAP
jgi:hypothetical protein